jgi:iron complex outermembrane receptor protein
VFQSKSLKVGLFLSAATVATAGFSAYAQAQSAAGTTETVVVTGSRIAQQGVISASPITVVGQQEAQFQGTTSVESLLNNLPSVFSGQQNFTGNSSSGTATVDLRGLGASRTLVLVDGLRLAPGDPVVPYADLNQIPAALVDRVEVLTGGASAVYGSDAVAGVVNFIMRKDF